MEPFVILFACKVVFTDIEPVGEMTQETAEHNAEMTKYQPYEWLIKDSVMHCRRHVVQLYDPAVSMGADARPFTRFECMKAQWQVRLQFDMGQGNRPWRVWRTTCPEDGQDVNSIAGPRVNKQERCAVVYDNDIRI